jgi:hypothetical protein
LAVYLLHSTDWYDQEEKHMTEEMMKTLYDHLMGDRSRLGNVRVPVQDLGTINVLLDVMRDLKLCADLLRAAAEEAGKAAKPAEPATEAAQEKAAQDAPADAQAGQEEASAAGGEESGQAAE